MHENHLFVSEQTAQKEVVSFLSYVDIIRTFADTHAKETSNTTDSFFHALERNLEGLNNFSNFRMWSDSIPKLLELALWDYVWLHVITNGNTRIIESVLFFVWALFFLSVNINLGNSENETLLDLVNNGVCLLAIHSV